MGDTLARHGERTDQSHRSASENDRGRTGPVGWERDTARRNAPGWLSLDE